MKKNFLITVDTEGDNLWNWVMGKPITTNNSQYIPAFQDLCEKYGFKPVYLINYEMAHDDFLVNYLSKKSAENLCEIGMHLHAWNTPPQYDLPNIYNGNPYITEYPADVIEQKVATMKSLLSEKFESEIVSHRSGRWATNEDYFKALKKHGIKIDCSVTPQVDLSSIPGCSAKGANDYRHYKTTPYEIYPGILEVPMTTRCIHTLGTGSLKHKMRNLILGEQMWLRPIKKSFDYLTRLSQKVIAEPNNDYLEFMIHSSELMPNGSVYFKTQSEVDALFELMDKYFNYVSNQGYTGATLAEYVNTSFKGEK